MAKDSSSKDAARWLQAVDFNQQLAQVEKEHHQEMRETVLSFLEVLDSFDRCFSTSDQMENKSPRGPDYLKSFKAVRRQLRGSLERAGVRFMDCQGQPFDPQKHKAIEVQFKPDLDEDMVVEEVMRGCEWRGELLRLAQVAVSRKRH